mmetsp:Transcript_49377/g.86985  ORF Transcript_49377/g.86985 Transcript_49377/m.86985 type:complete len:424 (+) Transcript_49377:65-1336(+)
MAGRILGHSEDFPLSVGRYAVAISWDKSGQPVDVDLQGVVVDNRGAIIDAVYYNNLKALRCITHSGDEQSGEKAGHDEVIWVGLNKLPDHVRMIIFVIAAHSGGHLRDVRNGLIHVLEERQGNEVARFTMENSEEEVDMVAAFVRSDRGSWYCQVIDEPAQDGQHFMDILEPSIGNFIRKHIPSAPRRQKVAFAMEKGAVFDLPRSSSLGAMTACLGWDVEGDGVDLDVSAVFFDASGKNVDACFFGNLESCGFVHTGDNLTGEGEGDDERIMCNLDSVPANVQQVFFVVNIYSRGVTFECVRNAYCRIVDSSDTELARYELREAAQQNALVIARLFREDPVRWGFQALGTFACGQTWKDSVMDMRPIFQKSPRELQFPGQTTMRFSGAHGYGDTQCGVPGTSLSAPPLDTDIRTKKEGCQVQ